MSEITITINGRYYDVSCDAGQETRVLDLAKYVDQQVKEISKSGAAYNDSHLMVLASLVLANETLEALDGVVPEDKDNNQLTKARNDLERLEAEKEQVLAVITQLTERVDGLTEKVVSL